MKREEESLPVLDGDKYAGQWVAIHPVTHVVLGHGTTIAAALEQWRQGTDKKKPIIYRVPKSDAYFIGGG